MTWMLILLSAWAVVAVLLGLLIGRSVRFADERQWAASSQVPDRLPEDWTTSSVGTPQA